MDPDVDLIRRALARDDRAFGDLFDRHSIAVYRFAYAQTHDAVQAQELVQETFVTAWRKLADIRLVDASVLPWLIVTCRYHAQNLRRRSTAVQETLPLDEHIAQHGAADRERAEHAEELEWVFEAVNQLSETDRRVVELCLFEGRSYKEAALQLGISVSNVTKRVERSRTKLRRMRDEQFEGSHEVSTALPTDEEILRQLAGVRERVMEATHTVRSPRHSTTFRRARNLILAGATGLAMTAGGVFIAVSSYDRETWAQCYSELNLDAEVSDIQHLDYLDRDSTTSLHFDPVDQCAAIWAAGFFEPGADPSKADPIYPVPPLVACMLSNNVAAVFPNQEELTAEKLCGTLGLAVWGSDSGV